MAVAFEALCIYYIALFCETHEMGILEGYRKPQTNRAVQNSRIPIFDLIPTASTKGYCTSKKQETALKPSNRCQAIPSGNDCYIAFECGHL